jgi:hypothetical protein
MAGENITDLIHNSKVSSLMEIFHDTTNLSIQVIMPTSVERISRIKDSHSNALVDDDLNSMDHASCSAARISLRHVINRKGD